MTSDVSRDEFKRLESRVDVVEREVDGEKLVTRYILEQTRRNGDDLAAIKTRLDRVEGKVDGLERRFDGLESKVGGLERMVGGLARDLPGIVGDAVREAFRARDSRG